MANGIAHADDHRKLNRPTSGYISDSGQPSQIESSHKRLGENIMMIKTS